MDLKSLTVLIMLISYPTFGAAIALSHRAGVGLTVLFAISGLLVAAGLVAIYSKFVDPLLNKKRFSGSLDVVRYFLFPLVGILVLPFLISFLGFIIYE
jgi:hypothetical protein